MTPDDSATVVAAQAFMQGLYPPYNLTTNGSSTTLDPNSAMSDGEYLSNPLGTQFPVILNFSPYDPTLVYLQGETNCLNYDNTVQDYYSTSQFKSQVTTHQALYQMVGQNFLTDLLPKDDWSYGQAYSIYDYVSFESNHNKTALNLLSSNGWTNVLSTLFDLASEQEFAQHGNLSASGEFKGDRILSVSGQTLAAEMLNLLGLNIASNGTANKFNLIVGDYPPMMALFALLDLPSVSPGFQTIPSFGSALVFELFSWQNGTGSTTDEGTKYPSEDELFVRFYYRNTTGDGSTDNTNGLQSFGVFNDGVSNADMKFTDFEQQMKTILLSDLGEWCALCGSPAIWCPAFSAEAATPISTGRKLSPVIAGVIGAAVTIGVLALLVAAAMILGGLRVHRRERGHKRNSSLGGFKGSRKLASDTDLVMPTDAAAPIGVAFAGDGSEPKRGHERVGSWEMKSPPSPVVNDERMQEGRFWNLGDSTHGVRNSHGPNGAPRVSFDRMDANHEAEIDHIASQHPVQPNERV